ncbi:MAG: ligase-associated DNA damage response DEXH box helicase [Rhizobiales bacterium]|nr:ligase-associated DNA damage response DEXH box helicase [Hyphomicrobiales bacterium]
MRAALPSPFADWFAARGWRPRAHQLALLSLAEEGRDSLLVAPTGAGKTLAGFLPTLVDLTRAKRNRRGLHTLYISPLKALAVDVARNLETPIAEMGLPIRVETRTGDTSSAKRQRQRRDPPDILMTTPEQLALLLASADAETLFADVRRVVLDELHALAASKRGDLLALGLARLRALAPRLTATGLSATVLDPRELARWLSPQRDGAPEAAVATAAAGADPDIAMLETRARLPWAGHSALHAIGEIYARIKAAKMTLVFVNTRSQAEAIFQQLWRINEDGLAIALHHGSLDAGQRRKVEAAMAAGRLKAVVCTSTLDLGIDWGDVDLVVNVGAPKGSSRLLQRIGRANHRLDDPSRALLVPANRFEALECLAAIAAAQAGEQDAQHARAGALDVLCQHILGMACAAPFSADALYAEVTGALPYAALSRADFDAALNFVATGGYALGGYERFAKIRQTTDGLWRIANARVAQQYRLNVGTIVESEMLKVRLTRARRTSAKTESGYSGVVGRGGRVLGEIEEYFIEQLSPGDTFVFGGEILALQGVVDNEALVTRSSNETPKVPSYAGGRFPLSTYLAARVRKLLADPARWTHLPEQVRDWLQMQALRSAPPPEQGLFVETFPRGGRHYLVCYPFEGRLAHQTLGMLLTRRMERARLQPLGFVASDYSLAIWLRADPGARFESGLVSLDELFAQDMLGDDLEEWLDESAMMKRAFRNCAIVAGLVERRSPGKEKTGRQVTVSTDLVFDVLRRHEPHHILLRAARADASTGLLDLDRLAEMLSRVRGRIIHKRLDRVSPLAVPVLLDIGREPVAGEAREALLAEAAETLIEEATGEPWDGAR